MFAVMHFRGRAGMSPLVPPEVCSECEVRDGAWVLRSPAWPAAWPCVVGGQPWGVLIAHPQPHTRRPHASTARTGGAQCSGNMGRM